jgi:hypothetical protein
MNVITNHVQFARGTEYAKADIIRDAVTRIVSGGTPGTGSNTLACSHLFALGILVGLYLSFKPDSQYDSCNGKLYTGLA